jgi:hypothetical protein
MLHFRSLPALQMADSLTWLRWRKYTTVAHLLDMSLEGSRKRPAVLVLLLRGIAKGEPTARLARELHLSRQTVHTRRHQLQSNLNESAPTDTMEGQTFEVDEIYQNAGEKR